MTAPQTNIVGAAFASTFTTDITRPEKGETRLRFERKEETMPFDPKLFQNGATPTATKPTTATPPWGPPTSTLGTPTSALSDNQPIVPSALSLKPPGPPPFRLRLRRRWTPYKDWLARSLDYPDAVSRMGEIIGTERRAVAELSADETLVYTVANSKGGAGKTPLITCSATAIGDATGRPVLVLDANLENGGAADRLGIAYDHTLTQSEALSLVSKGLPDRELFRALCPTGNNVAVIRADDPNKVRFGVDQFRELFNHLHGLYPIIALDTGNSITGDIALACFDLADVVLFPLLAYEGLDTKGSSLDKCIFTRAQLALDGHSEKVDRGITVAVGVEEGGTTLDEFRRALQNPVGMMMEVPFDPYAKGGRVVRVEPLELIQLHAEQGLAQASLAPHTQLAYLRIVKAMFQQKASPQSSE